MTRDPGDPQQGHDRLQRLLRIERPATEVWAAIGGFGAIAAWHPDIAACEVMEIGGATHRRLTHADGSHSMERLADAGPHHWTAELVDGPFPAANCRTTLSAVAEPGGGCHLFWSALFEPTDPSADEIIAAFFETGLDALATRFA